jgi:hypothetical protein
MLVRATQSCHQRGEDNAMGTKQMLLSRACLGFFVCLMMTYIPTLVRAQTPQVTQKISDAAPNYGVNSSLAVKTAQMESDTGRDLGSLGNIFQLNRTNWHDMGGGDMSNVNIQIDRGLKYLAHDQQIATQALGRPPEDWETYMVHQQGDAGGPALMKAAPGAKAVDVVAPFYKNRATAEKAIIANLTAQDFIAFQTRRFEQKPQAELLPATPPPEMTEAPSQQTPCRRRPSLGGRCMIDSDNPPQIVELPQVGKHEF